MEFDRSKTKPLRIVALKPGVSQLGYAVFRGNDLMLFGVRKFNGRQAERRKSAKRFVQQLSEGFAADLAVMESETAGLGVRVLVLGPQELVSWAKRHDLRTRLCRPAAVKRTVAGREDATKLELAEAVVGCFPYLERYLRIDRRTGRGYWARMLEAVAIGLAAHESILKQRVLRALHGSAKREIIGA